MASNSPMISKRWLINFLLILLIIVFTYIGNKYNVKTGYQADNRITQLSAADVHTVDIKTADFNVLLRKVDGLWQLESPVLWYADNITVERIIDIVNAQTDSKLPISEIDPATLGLEFPRAIMRLNDTQITFGATNNIGERRYLQIDDTVYLLKDRYLPFINQGITGLLDRRLLPRVLPLQSLKLPGLDLYKRENAWSSGAEGVSAAEAGQIIENWQTLQAQFVKRYDADQTPDQKVIAVLETGGEIELQVLAITPQLVIARHDLGYQYHFNEQHYYGLLAAAKNEDAAD